MPEPIKHIYGVVSAGLAEVPAGAQQCSPRVPGASPLGLVPAGSSAGMVVHAPASVMERRRVLALALRALAPGASLVAIAHNTKGGTRLVKELEVFGCGTVSEHKRHHRIVRAVRPEHVHGLQEAIDDGDAVFLPDLGLWSQPGLFNWDRIDPGSALLLEHLPVLTGCGADLGCGIGVLTRAVREKNPATVLHLIGIDARALDIARRNLPGDGIVPAPAASPPSGGPDEAVLQATRIVNEESGIQQRDVIGPKVPRLTGEAMLFRLAGAALPQVGAATAWRIARKFARWRAKRGVIRFVLRGRPTETKGRATAALPTPPYKGTYMSSLVTGLFPDAAKARLALAAVEGRGYSRGSITILHSKDAADRLLAADEHGTKAAEGAGIGAGVGGAAGVISL